MSKLCKDCVHCAPRRWHVFHELGVDSGKDYTQSRCRLTDTVVGTGEAGRLCAEERAFSGGCRPIAINFEPRPEQPPILLMSAPPRPWWRFW